MKLTNTILDGETQRGWGRPTGQYSSWRPSNYEIISASHRVSRRGPHASKRDTALVIYNIIEMFAGSYETTYTGKTGGYMWFDSPLPWEYWKVESNAWFDLERRKKLVAKVKSALPAIQIEPIFRTWRDEYLGTRGCILSFKKTKQAWAEETVMDVERAIESEDRHRQRASSEKYRSVWLYRALETLPDEHPVMTDPDVKRLSVRLEAFERVNKRLFERKEKLYMAAIKALSKANDVRDRPRMPGESEDEHQEKVSALYARYKELDERQDDLYEKWRNREPHRVEGRAYQEAVLSAWRRHFPKEKQT